MLKKSLLLSVVGTTALTAHSATFNLSGNYRFGANMFTNLDLAAGNRSGAGKSTSFLENRFLLKPDVVVDDRFTVRSEFSLLQLGPNATTQGPDVFGQPLGGSYVQRTGTSMVYLRRAWLDWASDWGVFSVGRQPKNWGLGLLYNAGNDPFDDFGTTVDRVGFRALLGNLGLNLGYEKAAEGRVDNEGDDAEAYEIAIDYSNPESLFDVGLLYTRNVRSPNSGLGLASSHDLSIFSRKRWNALQVGGEFANVTYGTRSVIGALAQFDYMPSAWNFGLDLGFAGGGATNHFSFHPNYRPFLLLFNQSLGTSAPVGTVRGGASGASSAVGNAVANGDGNGAFITKANFSYAFENKTLILGSDIGFASLVRQGNNAGTALGFETDFHLTQKWYENFKTSYNLGLLFPGAAFGTKSQVGWGVQIRGALTF